MPDKEIMLQIRKREEELAWNALDELDTMPTDITAELFRAALGSLVEDWRASADLYEKAKLKGAKSSHIDPLRHAAQQLDIVIKSLQQPRRAPLGELQQPRNGAAFSAGLDEPRHRFVPGDGGKCSATVARDGDMEYCDRFTSHPAHRLEGPVPAGSPGGIDALIADSVAKHKALDAEGVPDFRGPGDLADPNVGSALVEATRDEIAAIHASNPIARLVSAPDFPGQASGDEVAAYLRGEADDLLGEPLQPSSVRDQTVTYDSADFHAAQNGEWARETLETMPVSTTIPPLPLPGQPGDAGSSYGHDYIPPGGVPATYAELMTPVPRAALPPHISHSQIGTVGECGVKYRLTRIGRTADANGQPFAEPMHQIPQWALIGGNAFHAAVEKIERYLGGDSDTVGLAMRFAPDMPSEIIADQTWHHWFEAEIQKIEASSPVPRSRWRASKGGAEGETWWNVNGPLMIERYLKARPAEPTAMIYNGAQEAVGSSAVAIELERTVAVQTPYGDIDYRAIIDRVTVRSDPQTGATTLVIRDYKTGDKMPYTHEQLGEYANVLRLLGVPSQVRIVGTYFNARKGVWMPVIDLDQAYSPEWFMYHVTTGHAQRLALTQGPTPAHPSTFCGGCPVRWACPVMGPGVKR